MSKETNQREILSAYFDGELTPEERQRAEQLLEETSSTRREIDEIAELSELVKSLPTETAPSELLPAVLRQAERDTLSAIDTSTKPTQRNSRSWMTVISGLAVTAAAVVLVIQMLPRTTPPTHELADNRTSTEGTIASNDTPPSEPLTRSESQSAPNNLDGQSMTGPQGFAGGSTAAPFADNGPPGESVASSNIKARGYNQALADRSPTAKAPAVAAAREAAPPKPGRSVPRPLDAADAFSMNAEALRNARRGDVVEYFSPAGTTVTTYMVTVVDVKKALDKMQVLLARNEIPARVANDGKNERNGEKLVATDKPRDENKNQLSDKIAPTADDADEQQERLIAVYVETTPDRFTSALKELLRDEMLADLYPKPPVDELQIEVAQLGQSRRQLFRQSGAAKRSNQTTPTEEETADDAKTRASAKRNARAKDAPTGSPELPLRKSTQVAEAKPQPENGKPATTKSESGKKGKQLKSKELDKAVKGLVTGRNRADAKLDAVPSFQLRVELAPRPKLIERQKSLEQRDSLANQPGFANPTAPQKNAPEGQQAEQSQAAPAKEAPVRVLFVFREAPRKPTP